MSAAQSYSRAADAGLIGVALAGTLGWLALFGLTDAAFLATGAAAVAYFAAAFYAARRCDFFARPRPRAWVLTLACAAPLGPYGAYKTIAMSLSGAIVQQSAHFSAEPLSDGATVLFVAFLVCDTVLGLAYYPAQFELVAGWMHHAVYLVFFALCLRWRMTVGVALSFPLELTTVVLALGHISPALRCDWLFGASFFALRICYHCWVLHFYCAMWEPPVTLWPFMAAVLLLHVHWFAKWALSMARRTAKVGDAAGRRVGQAPGAAAKQS